MNEDYWLQPLRLGDEGCTGKGSVEVPGWVIVELSRLAGCSKDVGALRPDDADPQGLLYLFRVVAGIADKLKRQELKPIPNRNREWSQNIIQE